jgi:hypothetical protein
MHTAEAHVGTWHVLTRGAVQGEVKHPCKSVTFAPSDYQASARDNKGAPVSLSLDFIYGYASGGRDPAAARCNVFYNAQGKIVYPAGTFGVVYDPRSHTQKFFTEHDAPISYLAMHPNKRYVATAGVASDRRLTSDGHASVSIMMWDSTKDPPVRVTKPFARHHQYSIHALAFSTSGKHLITLGGDSKYQSRLIIYQWAKAGLGQPGEMENKEFNGILELDDGPCIIPAGGQFSLTLAPNPYVTDTPLSEEILRARGPLYGEKPPRVETGKAFNFVHCVDKFSRMYDMSKMAGQPTRAARIMTGFTTPQKGLSAAWVPPSWFPSDPSTPPPSDEVAAVGLELGDIFLFQLVGSEITVTNKFEMAHAGAVLSLLFVVKTPPGSVPRHLRSKHPQTLTRSCR